MSESNPQDRILFSNAAHLHLFNFMTGFFGMFSEFAGAFETAVKNLGTVLSGKEPEIKDKSFADFFTSDMESMGNSVIEQLGETDYVGLYLELAQSNVDFEKVKNLAKEIKLMLPSLTPLTETLSSSSLLAYTAVCNTDSKEKKILDQFLGLFKEVFDKMQADADQNR